MATLHLSNAVARKWKDQSGAAARHEADRRYDTSVFIDCSSARQTIGESDPAGGARHHFFLRSLRATLIHITIPVC
jgi:hypothetical protein